VGDSVLEGNTKLRGQHGISFIDECRDGGYINETLFAHLTTIDGRWQHRETR
jgi:hypothetical protein